MANIHEFRVVVDLNARWPRELSDEALAWVAVQQFDEIINVVVRQEVLETEEVLPGMRVTKRVRLFITGREAVWAKRIREVVQSFTLLDDAVVRRAEICDVEWDRENIEWFPLIPVIYINENEEPDDETLEPIPVGQEIELRLPPEAVRSE